MSRRLEPGQQFGRSMHPWDELQEEINKCAECKRLGPGLMVHATERVRDDAQSIRSQRADPRSGER